MKSLISIIGIGFSIVVFFLLSFLHCSPKQIAGSEVTNESATIYMPDGKTPATQANVMVIPVDYIPEVPGQTKANARFLETNTNSKGIFTISGISKGLYNIIAQKDSFSSYQDSIYLGDSSTLQNDTLKNRSSLTGIIQVQPNHDPRSAIIQVLGTSYYSNVDSMGNFTIPDFPEGKYQLRIITLLPNYTPTFFTLQIHAGKNDTLKTPIKLIYTGIPIITGLKASFDPSKSIVSLKWDNVNYSNFNDFLIYRGDANLIDNSMYLISSVANPVYNDTISNLNIDTSVTHIIKLRYQIAVRSKSLISGEVSNATEVTVIFSPTIGNLLTSDTLDFTPNTPFKITIVPDPLLGEISNYYYRLNSDSQFTEISKPETTLAITAPADSIMTNSFCIVKVTTANNISILDTLYLQSKIIWEKLSTPFTQQIIGYYAIVKDNRIFVFAENNTTVELWSSTDAVAWVKLSDSLPFNSMEKPPLILKNKIMILRRDSTLTNATIWSSENETQWTFGQIDSLPNPGYNTDYEVWSTLGEKLVLINYYPACLKSNNCNESPHCWSTEDGFAWKSTVILNSLFPDRLDTPNKYFIAFEKNGSLFVGGAWRSMYLLSPAYKNYSFRIWSEFQTEPKSFSLPYPRDTTMIASYNPKAIIYKDNLFLTAQINMESSIDIEKNTKFLWKLNSDNTWYLCSQTFPATNNSKMKHNYHALIAFNNRLYSISNAGVWVARQ